jgi:hypothetical protein
MVLGLLLAVHVSLLRVQAGTVQLVGRAGQTGAALNGAAVHFKDAPVQIQGRTMVPLSETLSMLGFSLTHGATLDTVGGLSFSPALDQVSFNGSTLSADGNLQKRGAEMFVSAKLLADAIGAKLAAGDRGEFYITVVRDAEGDPTLPQPRFSTDRNVYGIGEPVKVEEFSFDPHGENMNLHWTNRQPAYFKAGPQTITLEAANRAGQSNKISRTITITDKVVNTPLEFDLKYAPIGDLVSDVSTVYPTLPRLEAGDGGSKLFVSDSPEDADRMGVLFRDTIEGKARLVAYHINSGANAARLCAVVKNIDSVAATFQTLHLGDTAPASIEGVLGQVTLLAFLTDHTGSTIRLDPGECALVYVSPQLAPKTGASVLADFRCDHRFELSLAMTVGETTLSPDAVAGLEVLPPDGRHVRGTFPTAQRNFTLDLSGHLPAKAVIGEATDDPSEEGEDPITKVKQVLDGNYGVSYGITLHNARGVVAAIAPRGGVYKGVVVVKDPETGSRELVRLPREGVLSSPNQPMIFLRSASSQLRLEFIPASGSQLPVHLVFYRP